MSDNRRVAQTLLRDATQTVVKDRPGIHGSAENSFEMIGDMWTLYLRHVKRVRGFDTIRPEDVAQMMSMLKKCRAIYGDVTNADNFIDDIGYTSLAGMLQLPDPEAEEEVAINRALEEMDVDATGELDTGIRMKHTDIRSGTPEEDSPEQENRKVGQILKDLYLRG